MSKRGHAIYRAMQLWEVPEPQEVAGEPDRPGRSAELHEARNERLWHRFVYWTRTHPQYQYEAHLKQLSAEFDLSEVTIGELIQDNRYEIARVRKDFPSTEELRARWWWMVW